ncbi:MAG: polysaccharide biosynthesis tyrosine autokinase [Planctomycetes bacterium]|nr:polysaccharide biosynthesis tyrosine autokinase [Planctomycetota bacterium]
MKPATWGDESTAAPESHEGFSFDLLGMLLRHWWLVVLGGIVGSGLGYLYFTKQIPVYQSSARMLVVRERSASEIPIRGIETRAESDPTATLLIRSPLIVADAVKTYDLANLPPFSGRGDPTAAIIGGLGVNVAGGNGQVLDLTFRGTDSQSCETILKAVINSYQTFLGKTHESVNEETTRLITDAKDNLLKQLSEKEAAYRTFRQDSPLLWNGKGETAQNIHQSRLSTIEGMRSGMVITRSQLKAQIQAIEAALARGENREALLLMTGRFSGVDSPKADGTASSTSPEGQLFPLLLEEQMLMENHGPDHPKLLSLRRRIELTRKYLTRSLLDTDPESKDEAKPKAAQHQDFLTVYLNSLRQEIKTSEEKERELNLLFEQERESAKSLTVYEVKDATFQADIKRTQQLFEGVIKRLEEINLMKNYGGYKTEVISPPTLGWQVEPNRNRILTLGLVGGLLGGLALAFLAEMTDRTFRSPDDVSAHLGLPIVGHIPVIQQLVSPKDSQSKLSPTLVSYFQPKSRLTEAYRAVRTSLYFSVRGEKHKVIQITSPNPGDGKSTLSTNLAICIAQSGKSVLLIDADFRRPRIHKLMGVESKLGMSTVIQGDTELPDAIQAIPEIPNLFILPCGTRPDNPAELLTSQRFDELLGILREKYDFVLVDTPPMLAVTDPGSVAARVDGVLMTIRISKRTRAEAARATELLKSLGANLIGVVVNGVGSTQGYGYGQYGLSRYYRYRYGYGYGYGYGYKYGYGENGGAYYQDDKKNSRLKSNGKQTVDLESRDS